MSTSMKRIPVRASDTLQGVIRSAGPVSAATRALLWLGADVAGLPIPPIGRREIAALLVEEALNSAVVAALQQLYDRLGNRATGDTPSATTCAATRTAVPLVVAGQQASANLPIQAATAADGDDPFADVGRAFDG